MYYIILVVIVLIQLFLNFLVLTGNFKSKTNRWFAFMNTGILLWVITISLANIEFSDYSISLFINKMSFASVLFFALGLYFFVLNFPHETEKYNKTSSYTLIFIVISWTSGIFFTNLVVKDLIRIEQRYDIDRGLFYLPYILTVLLLVLISIIILVRRYQSSQQIDKAKIRLLAISFGLITAIVLVSNAIIPAITKTTVSSDYGPFAIIIWLAIIAYTIRKHRLLDIRFLLGKILYYLVLSILPYTIFYLTSGIQTALFGSIYATGSYILGAFFAILFVIFFNWAHNFIRKSIDSNIINPGYSPLETVDELSNQLATTLDIKDIGEEVLSTISKTIRPAYESLTVTPNKEQGKPFIIDYDHKSEFTPEEFASALEIWKVTGKDPIVSDEIQQELFSRYAQEQEEINQLRQVMEKHQIKVLVPLGQKEEVSGIMVLGMKEADSPYTVQDIEFLKSLANTARVAVERALFYEEVVDLNRNLQKKVDEATKELQIKNTDLQSALDIIKEVQRRERDMIDIMGHELRTPITIVRNAVSLLNSGLEKNKSVPQDILVKYIKMAQESAEREVGLIETLLSATKVDAQRLQLFKENVDFNDVIHDSILALKTRAQTKDLEIRYKEPEKLPEAYADRTRIQEVVDNLLSNAIKYTEKGHIDIVVEVKGDFLQCSIIDTGYGIPKEDIANLGKKFYRVQNHATKDSPVIRPGGTGLGLYVTFEIVKGHGGEVKVTSEVGKGSNFTFTVPIYKNQKIEKPRSQMERDIFKRLGKKTKAELEKAGGAAKPAEETKSNETETKKSKKVEDSAAETKANQAEKPIESEKKPRQREIAD